MANPLVAMLFLTLQACGFRADSVHRHSTPNNSACRVCESRVGHIKQASAMYEAVGTNKDQFDTLLPAKACACECSQQPHTAQLGRFGYARTAARIVS